MHSHGEWKEHYLKQKRKTLGRGGEGAELTNKRHPLPNKSNVYATRSFSKSSCNIQILFKERKKNLMWHSSRM